MDLRVPFAPSRALTSRLKDCDSRVGHRQSPLAPTATAGIYGMNFKYMPELEWWLGYPFVLLLMVEICGTLYYRFRRAPWL